MADLFYYMQDKLFIPKKCKVGFNVRTDTYTGMLGYIIYHDGKAWRKLTSWEGWREKHLDTEEFEKKKKEEFERQIESQTKNHATYIEMYNKEKGTSGYYATYYKKYAEMTLAEYLKEVGLADYNKFTYRSPTKETNNPKLIPVEFDNVPTDGFVLNKKAGGYSSGWNHRSTYCRVWDPRGFEFEISIPNLLFILQETSSVKGKGLEGEFVYAWEGKDLVLLPAHCEEYRKSSAFTQLQEGKVKAKELEPGISYKTKNQQDLIYLGKFEWFHPTWDSKKGFISKEFVFADNKGGFVHLPASSIAQKNNDTVVTNYAELVENFQNSSHSGLYKDFESKPASINPPQNLSYNRKDKLPLDDIYYIEKSPTSFKGYRITGLYAQGSDVGNTGYYRDYYYGKNKGYMIDLQKEITFNDGVVNIKSKKEPDTKVYTKKELDDMGFKQLFITQKSGKTKKLI